MCGIVGYVGTEQAAPVLLEGLTKLEYRGYDSAGIAVRDGQNVPVTVKEKGRIADLKEKIGPVESVIGTCGIGHTRWATHGAPSETNAHPHHSDDDAVIGVHNGIIENYEELIEKLKRQGYKFYSQTDTEVMIKLIDYYYKKYGEGPLRAISRAILRVRGSYALCLMFADYPGEIFCARNGSPMIIGKKGKSAYIASDVPAILNHTRKVYYIDNMEMARLKEGSIEFYNIDCEPLVKNLTEITWDAEAAERGGYEHFMLKEIHEQPKAVEDTIHSVTDDKDKIDLSATGMTADDIKAIDNILIIGCGSAYHV
ncbi:MAG: glutamine--fructose-6-phosphate aminotransferase, partial [Clostridia bacterium]|nr:glutamine--fructose-6-phosphate aminotransferase [Clostridia bacterium]